MCERFKCKRECGGEARYSIARQFSKFSRLKGTPTEPNMYNVHGLAESSVNADVPGRYMYLPDAGKFFDYHVNFMQERKDRFMQWRHCGQLERVCSATQVSTLPSIPSPEHHTDLC